MKKTVNTFTMIILTGLMLMNCINTLQAQEYSQSLISMNASEAEHLKSLVEDLQPSVYISESSLEQYGDQLPKVANCEITSVGRLYELQQLYSSIEIIRININSASELSYICDYTQLSGFYSLKYILLVFQYDVCGNQTQNCLANYTNTIVQNISPKVKVLYRLDIIE